MCADVCGLRFANMTGVMEKKHNAKPIITSTWFIDIQFKVRHAKLTPDSRYLISVDVFGNGVKFKEIF